MATKKDKPKSVRAKYKFGKKKMIPPQIVRRVTKSVEMTQKLVLDRQVSKLVVAGESYENISEKLGISTNEAFALSKKIIEKWSGELSLNATEMREIAVKRLDAMIAVLWPYANPDPCLDNETGMMVTPKPDMDAVKTIIQLEDRRAKLLGLDAADKMKQQVIDSVTRRYIGGDPDAL